MKLRDYQTKGIDLIRKEVMRGKTKVLFVLPTGGGKTVCFTDISRRAVEKLNKVLVTVYGKNLVTQTASKIDNSAVIMAGHKVDETKPVQVASISTIMRRDLPFLSDFKIAIIDEAHEFCQNSRQDFLETLNADIYIGFTATPYAVGKKGHTFWDTFVKPITPLELNQLGYLVTPEIYSSKNQIDTTGIKIVNGDYNQKELAKRASRSKVVGDIVENYKLREKTYRQFALQ